MKKYELLEREENGLCRVRALKDFGNVKKGDIGGYIEKMENLSQCGNAWVYGEAKVYGNAEVSGNSEVYENAKVYGNAEVYENAKVYGNARVSGKAWVYGDASVCGESWVSREVYIDSGKITGRICKEYESVLFIQTPTRLITIYKDLKGVQRCNIGCQNGMTLEQLEQRIQEDGGMEPHRQQYIDLMKQIRL
ncbi:MAG: hypothetical protein ACRC28_18480 [Clostridium sp.]|uniref:hypothetical protein n=1 Tax=Clostridium sp. TaxID=1506 RepID=UPI003F39C274